MFFWIEFAMAWFDVCEIHMISCEIEFSELQLQYLMNLEFTDFKLTVYSENHLDISEFNPEKE